MARLDRDMPDGVSIPKSYSTVEDAAAKIAADATPTAYVPDQNVVTGRQPRPGDPSYAKFVADRLARQTTERETGGGTQPPSEAPPGTHWSFINGAWKLYQDAGYDPAAAENANYSGLGTKESPKMYKGKPFTGSIGTADYIDGVLVDHGTPGGKTYTASDGKTFTDAQAYATYQASLNATASNQVALDAQTKAAAEQAQANRQSAYDLLLQQFSQYGLSSLVEPLKELITSNISPSEFALRLQGTDAYKKRFAANQDRINQGLRALTPAEYIGLEDQYQNIMRNYGLPASYYSKDSMGTQAGFNKFIANDVSAAELEDRIATAQKRVINADPAVTDALRQFYPDITNADILAYTLDPSNALENIKRKVTAAEIGGAALQQGLGTSASRAEELAKYGITKAQAQQGYGQIGEFLPTAQKLSDIYQNQGLGAYDQSTAEKEVFGTAGSAQAAQKRKKLTQLEQAQFGGQAGTAQGALDRGRQGSF